MPGERRPLDRFLGLFAEVRTGESLVVLAMTLNVFLLLTAYYLLKPVREALILSGNGSAELKSYVGVLQAIVLALVVVPAYGWVASRVPRRRLIDIVTLFFVACMAVFYVLARAHMNIGVIFFLWVGIYSLMIVAQFWSFANDIYTPEAGKRLFAIIGFGASLGAVAGGAITKLLVRAMGTEQMLILAAVLMLVALALTHWVDGRSRTAPAGREAAADVAPLKKTNSFKLITHNRYLLLMALLILAYNWVNSNGEYVLSSLLKEKAQEMMAHGQLASGAEEGFIAEFSASYATAYNVLGLLLQLFVVSRLIKYFDVPFSVCVMPILSLLGMGAIALVPSLAMVRAVKISENATDYSLQNTVKQMLFLPLSREEKYTGKQGIDTFFVRSGDLLSAGLVYLGSHFLMWGARDFAFINIVIAVAWLVLAIMVGREYRRRVAAAPAPAIGAQATA